MAESEHLDKLYSGVQSWNKWRKEYTEIQPDLREADLRAINLDGIHLSGADLRGANFCWASLNGASFTKANLSNAKLTYACLDDADLSEAFLDKANLDKASLDRSILNGASLISVSLAGAWLMNARLIRTQLIDARLVRANFLNANLRGAVLTRASLIKASLVRVDLTAADLTDADLTDAKLVETRLVDANCSNAIFVGANLRRTDAARSNLTNTKFYQADLSEANFVKANLSKADLSFTHLNEANFNFSRLEQANLKGAKIGWTIFGDIDLRTVKGLHTIHHDGPSTVGINTILRSEGDIFENFFRGTGATDTFITYARSLAQHPIDYYTCFISYSNRDEAFVRRLHADLQSRGVRCWFAPEDMKIGDKIRSRIDESIRLYDKLLLVLSTHSVESTWVEHEVEMALAKEHKEKRTVLFPIRLDKAILEQEYDGWPSLVRYERHIGDFTHWKDHDHYKRGFDRLLYDLKAESSQEKKQE